MLEKGIAALTVDGKKIARISGCTLDYSREMIEQTEIGRSNKSRLPGVQSWSISGEGTADFVVGTGHAELIKAMNGGNKVQVTFTPDGSRTFSGSGYLTSLSVDMSSGSLAAISFEIAGSGELSRN